MPWGEEYTGATLVDMYLAELAAHTWDLAQATEQLDRLASPSLRPHSRGHGPRSNRSTATWSSQEPHSGRRFPHRPAPTTGNASPPSWDATHGHR